MVFINLLGIDLSLTSTGISIFKDDKLIYYGKIVTKKDDFENEDLRMNYIGDELEKIIKEYKIDTIVCENQFTGANSKITLSLRKLMGVICRVSYKNNIIPTYYLPAKWRGILKLTGTDKKKLAYEYVIKQGINVGEFKTSGKKKTDDICDAICISLAYLKNKERK